jgi:two-component system, chemotaxis family, CheB/CheR fusion protein
VLNPNDFPIVAIGSSAGGLDALSKLIQPLSADTGMAFVIVTHMAPTQESNLASILSRSSKNPVKEIKTNTKVEPNHIYVMAPNSELTFSDGVINVVKRNQSSLPTPIDRFFISLVKSNWNQIIGVVLSGQGSDGSFGIREIKEHGGITFAQDPITTDHPSMPLSAIATGVDFVCSPEAIADEIQKLTAHPSLFSKTDGGRQFDHPEDQENLGTILRFLSKNVGTDFTNYKQTTISRRIKRRMMLQKIETFAAYLKVLKRDSAEIENLCDDLLIKVTSFFRDPSSFSLLSDKVLPEILKRKSNEDSVRIWVPGCSTGEEAYSIAISLFEAKDQCRKDPDVQIFATDLSEKSIKIARDGVYPETAISELPDVRRKLFFSKTNNGYQINKSIRDCCVFAAQDVTKGPPFSNLDMISCRNLLIYFDTVLQKNVIPLFHYALRNEGYLLLGNAESISGHSDLFRIEDKKNRLYIKKMSSKRHHAAIFPATLQREDMRQLAKPVFKKQLFDESELTKRIDQIVLSRLAPAGFVVTEELDVIQFRGITAPYVEHQHGSPNLNLLKIIKEELKGEVRNLAKEAKKRGPVQSEKTIRVSYNGTSKITKVHVTPVKIPQSSQHFFLVIIKEFNEPKQGEIPPKVQKRKATKGDSALLEDNQRLERDLQETRENMQSVFEEQESTNEELKSANEEIISSNEEMQSTNEELETAKEELQSSNEELNTVNDELRNRSDVLTNVSDDLQNIINSTRLPVVILSRDLKIRRFSPIAEKLFRLIPSDVGRPITDIKPKFKLDNLKEIALEVIDSIHSSDHEICDEDGLWYSMQFRPYLTADHKVSGVVLTCLNIDVMKKAFIESVSRLAQVVRDSNDAIIVHDLKGDILEWNLGAKNLYGYTKQQALKMQFADLCPESYQDEHLHYTKNGKEVSLRPFQTKRKTQTGDLIDVLVTVTILKDNANKPFAIANTERDISEKLSMAEKFQDLYDNSPDMYASVSPDDGKIISCNQTIATKLGYTKAEIIGQPVMFLYHPDCMDFARKAFKSFVTTGSMNNCELILKRKDESKIEVLLNESAVRDHAGKITHSRSVFRDISDVKERERHGKREASLIYDKKVAEDASQLKTEFLANVSHEIRTPLTAIVGFSEKLAEENQQPESFETVGIIKRNATHLQHLINDILDLSKLESGKVELEKKYFSFTNELAEVYIFLKRLAAAKSIGFKFYFDGKIPVKIFSDPIRFRQILSNVAGNAIKFTSIGSVDITVGLIASEKSKSSLIHLAVRDTGRGLTETEIPRLFKPFSQVDSTITRQFGGTGLGLGIARHLARALGGDVVLDESTQGKGSVFSITIDTGSLTNVDMIDNFTQQQLKITETSTQPEVNSEYLSGIEVLLVEDSPDLQLLTKSLLKSRGAKVEIAGNGQIAVDRARGKDFDLILMDIQMPILDGYEATKVLREGGYERPIVALTARLMKEELEIALASGCNDALGKPIDQEKLFKTVKKYQRK